MRAWRLLGWMVLALLLGMPGLAGAQDTPPAGLVVDPAQGELVVSLVCPTPAETLRVGVDNAPPAAVTPEVRGIVPPALAIVVEVSPAMLATGTPLSTRLRDAVIRSEALLDQAPPGTSVTVVAFDEEARVVLPLSSDRGAARATLAALAADPSATETPPAPAALAEGLRHGLDELRRAPPGPRTLVAFTAGTPDLSLEAITPPGDPIGMTIVGHGGDLAEAAEEPGPLARAATQAGATYLPYHTETISTLLTLNEVVEKHFATVLAPGAALRLRVPAEDIAPGPHLLTVEGCGMPIETTFESRQRGLSMGLVAGVVAVTVAGGGLAFWRFSRRPQLAAPMSATVPTGTAHARDATAITTARRAAAPVTLPRYRVAVWDGRQHVVYPLEGRQWLVGRDQGCAIRIENEWVAGLHARLSLAGDRLELTDLESANGTAVGDRGRLLTPGVPRLLHEGDVVLIGPEVRLSIEPLGS